MIRGAHATTANMVNVTLRYMGDAGPTSPYYTSTIVVAAIDAAAKKLNRDTAFNRADMTIPLATSVYEYSVGTHTLEVYGVTYGSAKKRLACTTRAALNRDESGWDAATAGEPDRYYLDGMKMGVVPKPDATAAATVLHVHYLKSPDKLANATSSPTWLPVDFQDTICKLAAIDLIGAFNAAGDGSNARIQNLYRDYLIERQQMAGLAIQRSREYRATITPTGYSTFRR